MKEIVDISTTMSYLGIENLGIVKIFIVNRVHMIIVTIKSGETEKGEEVTVLLDTHLVRQVSDQVVHTGVDADHGQTKGTGVDSMISTTTRDIGNGVGAAVILVILIRIEIDKDQTEKNFEEGQSRAVEAGRVRSLMNAVNDIVSFLIREIGA